MTRDCKVFRYKQENSSSTSSDLRVGRLQCAASEFVSSRFNKQYSCNRPNVCLSVWIIISLNINWPLLSLFHLTVLERERRTLHHSHYRRLNFQCLNQYINRLLISAHPRSSLMGKLLDARTGSKIKLKKKEHNSRKSLSVSFNNNETKLKNLKKTIKLD